MHPGSIPQVAIALGLALALSGCFWWGGGDTQEDRDPRGGVQAPDWPPVEDAEIRPGVRVASATGVCTSNFVYQSPDNRTLYLGLAAHCLSQEGPGEEVVIADGVAATVAYDSWYTMDRMTGDPGVSREVNDFALIEIPDGSRGLVHPAVLHFGGPTGSLVQADTGDRVVTFGSTPLREGVDPADPREGYVLDSDAWYTRMYILTPGLPGDSGSPVLAADGRALGVLIHLGVAPFAASNGAVNLEPALAFAAEHAGVDVRLATWDLLDPGLFPDPGATTGGLLLRGLWPEPEDHNLL